MLPKAFQIEEKIFPLNGTPVLIDRDVAQLYGVPTKRINEAVKNNPNKFPEGYVIPLKKKEWDRLRSKNSTANTAKIRVLPKAFTEKGLYMLATILRSDQAVEATISIIETFTQLRALQQTVNQAVLVEEEKEKKSLLAQGGALMADLLDTQLEESESETHVELNFAVLKLKHIRKRKK